jgi:hypothetical protein
MHILFCDVCNESVPEAAVGNGTAYYRKGRLICENCDQAMGGGGDEHDGPITPVTGMAIPDALPPGGLRTRDQPTPAASEAPDVPDVPAPATRGAGAGGVLVGLVALGFAAVGFSMMLESIEGVRGEMGTARAALEEEIRAGRSEQRAQAAALPGLLEVKASEVRASEQVARDVLRGSIETLRVSLAAAEERERQNAESVLQLRDEFGKKETATREREDGLKENIANLEQDVRFFSDRMIELEESLRAVSARGPLAGAPAAGSGNAQAPGAKSWQGLLADLKHANAGIRLDAIYALGETGDLDVAPHLIPMLTDVDLFVRMATARMLEDLDARAAVPALIEALEDNQSAVREAAMVALRKVTSRSFGFEPVAGAGDRAKRVKAWRDWWKKEGEAFLTN